jgi:hypothetical protein
MGLEKDNLDIAFFGATFWEFVNDRLELSGMGE